MKATVTDQAGLARLDFGPHLGQRRLEFIEVVFGRVDGSQPRALGFECLPRLPDVGVVDVSLHQFSGQRRDHVLGPLQQIDAVTVPDLDDALGA
jgi:hypothetical protein